MKSTLILEVTGTLAALAITRPILVTREVPQEHSHQKFLTSVAASLALNKPDKTIDSVFGLLGYAVDSPPSIAHA
jgi:hypothetical protein